MKVLIKNLFVTEKYGRDLLILNLFSSYLKSLLKDFKTIYLALKPHYSSKYLYIYLFKYKRRKQDMGISCFLHRSPWYAAKGNCKSTYKGEGRKP
jgi:hypothetical protein